jgi:hypothetical protein
MKQEQAHSDDHDRPQAQAQAAAQLDIANQAPGKRTLTEGIAPVSAPVEPEALPNAHRPDRIDKQVKELPPDQQAYYEEILAQSPDPTDHATRKDALATAKSSRPLTDEDRQAVIAAREKLASMKPKLIDDGTNPHLHQIEITFDGTWNSRDDMVFDTNPALINDMFEGEKDYQVGVGTSKWTKLIGGATGAGIGNRINSAYDNVVAKINALKSADPKAEVVLIISGFSRGSTAARAFANELNKRGVPDLSSGDGQGGYTRYHEGPRIGVMILFDTVGSVGIPGNNINPGLDLAIPANAENVLHLTAGDEHRSMFPLSSAVDPTRPDDPRISEVELPGAHSDVGGSYPNAYSKIPLHIAQQYMVDRGVHVKPVNPSEVVDPADPRLRLHNSGGSATNQRTVYPSHNPQPN